MDNFTRYKQNATVDELKRAETKVAIFSYKMKKGTFRSMTMLNGPRRAMRNMKLIIQPSEGSLISCSRFPG
jgi:hypothetical protein